MSTLSGVGEEHCRGRFRCLPCFICQREEWVCAGELCALHVGSEDHRVSSLGEELFDNFVDDGFLFISARDPPGLFGEREPYASWIKGGVALSETANDVVSTTDVCDAVQKVVSGSA